MFNGLCHTGTWGSLGSMGIWGWIGLILNLVFWVGLVAGIILLVVRSMRRARVPASTGQPTPKEILQAQYARGEITREEYELRKQDTG
jgi:putative membrane protein